MKYNLHNINGPHRNNDFLTSAQRLKAERELDSAYDKIRELVKENKELKLRADQQTKRFKDSIDYNHKIVSILAHDLRSPFNSIIGFLEMIQNDHEMDESMKSYYINIILSVANNALEMLDILLHWVVNRNSTKSFEPLAVNLYDLVEEASSITLPIAAEKQTKVSNLVPPNLNIVADPNILKAVIRNLTSNSVKFTSENGKINVEAQISNNQVIISVSDNGKGFDTEYLENIFNSETYESNETLEDRWKGLGLMLCKDFIEIHGGQLSIRSDKHTGTVVKIILPQSI